MLASQQDGYCGGLRRIPSGPVRRVVLHTVQSDALLGKQAILYIGRAQPSGAFACCRWVRMDSSLRDSATAGCSEILEDSDEKYAVHNGGETSELRAHMSSNHIQELHCDSLMSERSIFFTLPALTTSLE